ncbi:MAG TPA: universal stress protein [Gaiella sp.]|uniref:universal stress protein n=1 Tax=Gaiella sp. TaxID=2663207 RepID=UPI002D7FDD98|nr:universal stress protein [Gaiella sp.]HET9288884.1 universal stress protein [Gaiella sp.]
MPGRIVVGIDGSEHAAAALRWAVEEAALRGATVEAVHAWSYVPVTTPADSGLVPMAWTESADVLEATQHAAERIASEQVRDVLGDDHGVTVSLVQGDATDALITAAEGADLLVVGNRGRGALAEALLGSTSGRIADHAPCPVVIVRAHPAGP